MTFGDEGSILKDTDTDTILNLLSVFRIPNSHVDRVHGGNFEDVTFRHTNHGSSERTCPEEG